MFQVFEIGPFLIWSRLVFVLAGVWLSVEFFLRLSESANLSLQNFRDRGLWYILAFIGFGRFMAIIAQYRVYWADPLRVVMIHDGNFSFIGGAIGVAILLYVLTRGQRSTFLQWLDVLLPATTLGLVFSWLGSFLAGDAYGRPTDALWGVTYDAVHVRYAIPVHPVQLYYAAFSFLLTFLLLVIRKKARRVGSETLLGIVTGCVGAFFLEYFRGDFSIPVFATTADFLVLLALFISLGVFAVIETRITPKYSLLYEIAVVIATIAYVLVRPLLDLETVELRLSQLLCVLALLVTVVYVVVERRRHPYF